jgi:hypothetical protein
MTMVWLSKGIRDAIESAENAVIIPSDAVSEDKPNYECPAYREQRKLWQKVRDLYEGTERLRELEKIYLPSWEGEEDKDYKDRVKQAVLFPALERTANGLAGMVFRKDPILGEDVSDLFRAHAENIDLAGRALPVFAKDLFLDAVLDGASFVHVDRPPKPREARWKSQMPPGLRAYWAQVTAADFINWNWEIINGAPTLTLVVYRESVTQPKGRFGQQTVTRYRELQRGAFRVWEARTEKDETEFHVIESGPVSLDYIPFFPCYTKRTGFFRWKPPLLGLGNLNLRHYRIDSEHDHARTIASTPIFFTRGCEVDSGIKFGPNYVLKGETDQADAKWIETEGRSLGETRQDLKDIEGRMAAMGLSLLMSRPSPEASGDTTATSDLLRKGESDSQLQSMATALKDCLENAAQAHAEFEGEGQGGSIEVNKDFHDRRITAQDVMVLKELVTEGKLDLDSFWSAMEEGEWFGDWFDRDVVRLNLEAPPV